MKICIKCKETIRSDNWICRHCGWKPEHAHGFPSFVENDDITDQGFEADAFSTLYEIEKNHFWFKSRNRLIIWAFKRFFPSADNYLEIGCGTGFVLNAIQSTAPQLDVSGSDLFPEGLAFAKKRVPDSKLFQMDAKHIPFRDEFKVIGAFDVLEHITQDSKVLAEIHTTLKDEGGIILTVPQHPSLWSAFDIKSHHIRRYKRSELLNKLSMAGFRTIFMSSFVTFLLPLLWLNRLRTNSVPDQGATKETMEIPKTLNFLFELVITFELILIRIGITLPFGGSLIAIATKN